jgi:hypothetical protein
MKSAELRCKFEVIESCLPDSPFRIRIIATHAEAMAEIERLTAQVESWQKVANDRLVQMNTNRANALPWKTGNDRYEKLRKLSSQEFAERLRANAHVLANDDRLAGDGDRFDRMVDAL